MGKFIGSVRAFAGTHAGQQIGRFVRIAAIAAAVGWFDSGHSVTVGAVATAVGAGFEVAFREWRRTVVVPPTS